MLVTPRHVAEVGGLTQIPTTCDSAQRAAPGAPIWTKALAVLAVRAHWPSCLPEPPNHPPRRQGSLRYSCPWRRAFSCARINLAYRVYVNAVVFVGGKDA
jgi:hypothetical protein